MKERGATCGTGSLDHGDVTGTFWPAIESCRTGLVINHRKLSKPWAPKAVHAVRSPGVVACADTSLKVYKATGSSPLDLTPAGSYARQHGLRMPHSFRSLQAKLLSIDSRSFKRLQGLR